MIALWMIYAVVVSAILAAAATILDQAAGTAVRQRRWIWLLAIVLSAGVPAWSALAPRLGVGGIGGAANVQDSGSSPLARASMTKSAAAIATLVARAEERSLGSVSSVLGIVWVAGAMLAVSAYGVAAWTLARRRRSWRQGEIDGQPVLVAPTTGPAVIGGLRPAIVVPEWSLDLNPEQRALMLEHERQHVTARDPLLLQAAALVATLMPWNLPAWWLVRRLRLAVELDCDARVLATGRDARAYGNLLLDVCARRLGRGPMLSPALFERSSSLSRRILAMHPERRPFTRARIALGSAIAVAVAAFACDMPSPEVVAPDGTNQRTKRLYGELAQKVEESKEKTEAMVSKFFPSVAKGDGGPAILYLVKSDRGVVVFARAETASGPEREERRGVATERPGSAGEVEPTEHSDAGSTEDKIKQAAAPFEMRVAETGGSMAMLKVRSPAAWKIPSGLETLQPNDIASVDVSKHAAGAVAPKPVSIVTIILKPGAKFQANVAR